MTFGARPRRPQHLATRRNTHTSGRGNSTQGHIAARHGTGSMGHLGHLSRPGQTSGIGCGACWAEQAATRPLFGSCGPPLSLARPLFGVM